jgi:ABC-type spermidine/putrescine transport system permease subunit II
MKPTASKFLPLLAGALFLGCCQKKEQSLSLLVLGGLCGSFLCLPLEIWARLRRGITPEINAISTLIFLVSVILILIWYHIRTRTIGKEARELLERP